MEPGAVPTGGVLAPATRGLLAAVREAATTDGRVDVVPDAGVDRDRTLVLGRFDYLRFRGGTDAPAAGSVPFAGETSYEYTAEQVPGSEVGDADEVVGYANLTGSSRTRPTRSGCTSGGRTRGVFDVHRYLRTENATYAVYVLHGDSAAHRVLRLDPAEPGPDPTVAHRAVPDGSAVPTGLLPLPRRSPVV